MRVRDVAVAATIAAATSGALARATRTIVRNYFPLADEWAILAHSHPSVAEPKSWFTSGFRDYFAPPDGLPQPGGGNFSRPLFNAAYWLVGTVAGPTSGRYLRMGQVGVGAAAGLTSLAVSRSGGSLRSATGAGALAPLMPALVPSSTLLVYPCMSFDPVAACLSQAATMAYDAGRVKTAAGLMCAGVLTKETALPTAGALPALYAWEHRRELLRCRSARRSLAALAVPTALWWTARRALGDAGIQESAYVLRPDPQGMLVRQARIAAKFPFWANLPDLRTPGWSTNKVAAAAQVACNALVMGGAFAALGSRLFRGERPTADEASFVLSYAFLNAVGTSPRYGVTFDLTLLTSLVRWRREAPADSLAVRAVTTGLGVGVATSAALALRDYPRLERNFLRYAAVGRKYIAALREFEPGTRVLVLNDPVTFWTPVKWLTKTMVISADVVKLADHPWSYNNLDGLATVSVVALEPPSAPGEQWRFTQSQGVDILAAYPALPTDQPAHVDYGNGIEIDLEPFADDAVPSSDRRRWAAMRITPGDRPAHLLYYDPVADEFRSVEVR